MSSLAVFFDVGGTLVEVSPSIGQVYAEACARHGAAVSAAAVQIAFDSAWVAMSRQVPAGADRYRLFPGGEQEWWERVSSHAFDLCAVDEGRRPPLDELRTAFARAEAWRVYPEARGVLERLRRAGCRMGVISNWDSRLPALLSTLGLDGYFEAVVSSARVGCEKPSPAIFEAALDALGVVASGSVHIGDRREEDYAGARAAGLRALLLDRQRSHGPKEDDVGDGVAVDDLVADLREAADRILT